MIKIKNLSLKFDEKIIFDDVDFEIPENKITMVVGPNGTGKTTLLKVITGQIKTKSKIENSFKKVFYLPQGLYVPKNLTAFDYLSAQFYKNNWKWFLNKEEKDKIFEVLNKMELFDKANTFVDKLSSGEMQKINIALGLLSDADIFLLDEPTSNMDLVNRIKILDMIKNLTHENITSVIVMHDLNLSASYGDYFIGIGNKNKIFSSDKNNFFKPEILNNIYDIHFKVVNNEEDFYIQIFN